MPADIEAASRDLSPRPVDEGALSVYRSNDPMEGQNIAAFHAITTGRPRTLDYLLVPDECFEDLRLLLRPTPVPGQLEYLSARHYLIIGLGNTDLRLEVARRILENDKRQLVRITEAELKRIAVQLVRLEPEARRYIRFMSHWQDVLREAGQ